MAVNDVREVEVGGKRCSVITYTGRLDDVRKMLGDQIVSESPVKEEVDGTMWKVMVIGGGGVGSRALKVQLTELGATPVLDAEDECVLELWNEFRREMGTARDDDVPVFAWDSITRRVTQDVVHRDLQPETIEPRDDEPTVGGGVHWWPRYGQDGRIYYDGESRMPLERWGPTAEESAETSEPRPETSAQTRLQSFRDFLRAETSATSGRAVLEVNFEEAFRRMRTVREQLEAEQARQEDILAQLGRGHRTIVMGPNADETRAERKRRAKQVGDTRKAERRQQQRAAREAMRRASKR